MEKVRDISFDIAKGIGIILVVIGHYVPDDAPLWYTGLVRFIYYFHMPLFFIIAGYFTIALPVGQTICRLCGASSSV